MYIFHVYRIIKSLNTIPKNRPCSLLASCHVLSYPALPCPLLQHVPHLTPQIGWILKYRKLRLKFRTKAVLRYMWHVGPTAAWGKAIKIQNQTLASSLFLLSFSSSIALFNAAFPCYKQRMTKASGPLSISISFSHVGNSEKASKQEVDTFLSCARFPCLERP